MFRVITLLIYLLIIRSQYVICHKIASISDIYQVPDFTIQDLFSGRRDDELANTLVTTGLLAIRVPIITDHNGSTTNGIYSGGSAVERLCQCGERIGEILGGESTLLADGKTTRSTIATATFGSNHPLSLSTHDIDSVCGSGLTGHLNEAREYVARAVGDAFVPALDRLFRLSWRSKTILPALHGDGYKTISSVIEEAKHLEHFHFYSKMNSLTDSNLTDEENDPEIMDTALEWHTDAGLFLAFIPAVSCADVSNPDQSFYIKVPTIEEKTGKEYGHVSQAHFPAPRDGEAVVVLMLGAGVEHWLHTPLGLKLRATRHSVRMKSGAERAWYGMMHLVPQDAIVQENPKLLTFGEMQRSMGKIEDMKEEKGTSLGCGTTNSQKLSLSSIQNEEGMQGGLYRRRLATVGPDDCNNSTNLFCWLTCRDVPDNGMTVDRRLEEGESVYCLDPAVLSESKDLLAAVDACADSFTNSVGGLHQEGCSNIWYRTDVDVPTYLQGKIIDDPADNAYNYSEKYCWGGTSMYMQGFEWEGLTCVIYLFQGWIITSRALLVLACLVTIAIGFIVEFIVRQRPIMIRRVGSTAAKLAVSVTFYGIQLTLAYSLMLVVMTFSGPLVLCVVLGLMTGHAAGNWGSDFTNKSDSGNTENTAADNSTPCCNVADAHEDDT